MINRLKSKTSSLNTSASCFALLYSVYIIICLCYVTFCLFPIIVIYKYYTCTGHWSSKIAKIATLSVAKSWSLKVLKRFDQRSLKVLEFQSKWSGETLTRSWNHTSHHSWMRLRNYKPIYVLCTTDTVITREAIFSTNVNPRKKILQQNHRCPSRLETSNAPSIENRRLLKRSKTI